MSRLDLLRQQAAKTREEREKVYQKNVQQALTNALSSNNLVMMTVMAQGGTEAVVNPEVTERIVTDVTRSVTNTITNYVSNFVGVCEQRDLSKRRIHSAVDKVYEMYFSEFRKSDDMSPMDVPYETKLDAVALKFEMEPSLWDTIQLVQRVEKD